MTKQHKYVDWCLNNIEIHNITAVEARDLIAQCLASVRNEMRMQNIGTMPLLKASDEPIPEQELQASSDAVIVALCAELGIDYQHPSVEDLQALVVRLETDARTGGAPQSIVRRHIQRAQELISKVQS